MAMFATALAGLVAQQFGYSPAFVTLGGIAALGLALWLLATSLVAPACRNHVAPSAPTPARATA